jgi:hypothetical protein
MFRRIRIAAFVLFCLLALSATSARANLFSLAVSGTISENSSGDSTIPVGTPWTFEITYDTSAPDLDFQSTGSPDPTFGRFTNTGTPPAMTFFHYQAGSYAVTLDDSTDFGTTSGIEITFTSIKGIDINLSAPAFFPHLAGGPVSFHADFANFSSAPIFTNDGLPTNTALSAASFDDSNVTLLPPSGVVNSSNHLTSLTLTAVPQLAGDFNKNGTVGPEDYLVWKNSFGSTTDLAADGNGDHVVDAADYTVWRDHLGAHGAGAGAARVASVAAAAPEPASAVMLAIGAGFLLARAKWRRVLC